MQAGFHVAHEGANVLLDCGATSLIAMHRARLAPNDFVRVSRALEVLELTGETMSAVQARHAFREERYRHRLLGRQRTQDELRVRVEQRTERWLSDGWVDEVRELVERGDGPSRPMGSVGYRQVHAHVRGELAASDLATAIIRATMVFARRQRTWLRDRAVSWV